MGITNTKDNDAHPEWLVGGNPNAIERQESAGQQELVNSEALPVDGSDDPAFAEMGIVFGDPVNGDDLFRHATLPEGWSKQATDHSMWSIIVDEDGKERASIFYKAAFYDRNAHIHPAKD